MRYRANALNGSRLGIGGIEEVKIDETLIRRLWYGVCCQDGWGPWIVQLLALRGFCRGFTAA